MEDSTGPNPVTPVSIVSQHDSGNSRRTRFVSDYNNGHDLEGPVVTGKTISLDFTAFRNKIEASLIADLRKMEGGISPRDLYLKSNPNLLHKDFTNPRNWYNTDARKKLIKTVSFNSNANNSIGGTFPVNNYKNQTSKLPRINTQERIRGTKSADEKTIKCERQIDKTLLRRGPSFDETKFRKTPNISLSETSLPPALRKSISWPRSRQDRRHKKQSTYKKNPKPEDSILSLPPLNPELGQPFLPHLPPHQPWVSSKTQSTKGKSKLNVDDSQDVYLYLGDESRFQEKIDKWFNDIPTDNDKHQAYLEAKEHLKIPTANILLPKHHIYKGQITDVLLDRDKVIVPFLKEPIQYSPVFNELRIQRKGRVDDSFEINRDKYKLKQKSSLQLKMTRPVMHHYGNNRIYSTKQINLNIEEKSSVHKTKQPNDRQLNTNKAKNNLSNTRPRIADRNTGMNFLLAKVDEGDDSSSEYSDEQEAQVETNEFDAYLTGDPSNEIVSPTLFPEAKPSVVNLVLSSERPTERQPHHIEMSLRKLAESQQDQIPEADTCIKTENQLSISNENTTEKASDSVVPHTKDRCSAEKASAGCANGKGGKDNTNDPMQQEATNHKDSIGGTKAVSATQARQSIPQGTVDSGLLNASNGVFHLEESAVHAKSNKSALTKYNVLEPFRDGSQPNIVLPKGFPVIVKPACNEWTHPPTYKLDVKPCEDSEQHEHQPKAGDLS